MNSIIFDDNGNKFNIDEISSYIFEQIKIKKFNKKFEITNPKTNKTFKKNFLFELEILRGYKNLKKEIFERKVIDFSYSENYLSIAENNDLKIYDYKENKLLKSFYIKEKIIKVFQENKITFIYAENGKENYFIFYKIENDLDNFVKIKQSLYKVLNFFGNYLTTKDNINIYVDYDDKKIKISNNYNIYFKKNHQKKIVIKNLYNNYIIDQYGNIFIEENDFNEYEQNISYIIAVKSYYNRNIIDYSISKNILILLDDKNILSAFLIDDNFLPIFSIKNIKKCCIIDYKLLVQEENVLYYYDLNIYSKEGQYNLMLKGFEKYENYLPDYINLTNMILEYKNDLM